MALVVFAILAAAWCSAQSYTLTVYSQNPDSGVAVAATPADMNGTAGGNTTFTLQYSSGTAVTLQAPSTQNGVPFAYWALDSTPHVFATSLSVSMTAAHTATAVYGQPFTITPQTTQNGVLSPSTVQSVPSTGSVTFTESSSPPYILMSWLVDGETLNANTNTTLSDGTTVNIGASTLSFANVLGNHTVGATFIQTFTLTPQSVQNGSLSPSSVQTVNKGAAYTFTETPGTGYALQTWQVDGTNVAGTTTLSDGTTATATGTTLVFANVSGNHTVGATFVQTYTITPQATQNGSLSPSTAQTVAGGGSLTVTETPATGYLLQSWLIDGTALSASTTLADGTTITLTGSTLTFSGIKGSHTVGATFVQTFTITPQAPQNGSLSPSTAQTIPSGGSVTITETPATGYLLQSWLVDGSAVSASTTLTDGTTLTVSGSTLVFGGIKGTHTVGATYVAQSATITPQSTLNGSLSPSTPQAVALGGSVTFTETAASGYGLQSWLVDGTAVAATTTLADGTTVTLTTTSLAFGNVRGNHTVGATFSQQTETITPQTVTFGSITPGTAQMVPLGGSVSFTATPIPGFMLQAWLVDGVNVVANTTLSDGTTVAISGATLTFANLKGSHTVGAAFTQLKNFTITPQSTTNGALTPTSPQTLAAGGSVSFTETPSAGYMLQAWQVDGTSVTANTTLSDGTTVALSRTTLTLGAVGGNHSIGATFTLQVLSITPQTPTNGSLNPDTVQLVTLGGTVTITATPATGYALLSWQIDGANVASTMTLADGTTATITGTTIVFANVRGSHTLGATFTQKVVHPADTAGLFTITINEVTAYGSAWRHGSTWPTGPSPVTQAFVTNAAAIWRSGEAYTYNPGLAQPNCWTPTNVESGSIVKAVVGSAVAGIKRVGSAYVVTVTVQAPSATKAYSLEEILPAGATVSSISDGGYYNAAAGAIRWGPFLDNKTRNVTYTLSNVRAHSAALAGTASFNGSVTTVTGARNLTGATSSTQTGGNHR